MPKYESGNLKYKLSSETLSTMYKNRNSTSRFLFSLTQKRRRAVKKVGTLIPTLIISGDGVYIDLFSLTVNQGSKNPRISDPLEPAQGLPLSPAFGGYTGLILSCQTSF
jgi:hypothetical protein